MIKPILFQCVVFAGMGGESGTDKVKQHDEKTTKRSLVALRLIHYEEQQRKNQQQN